MPVGVDQAPHVELTREIARRFNGTYRPQVFPEPQTLLTETPKILGTDGRKMSKSYGNAVYLTEPPADVDRKLSRMVTDPRRARRTDPGEPDGLPRVPVVPPHVLHARGAGGGRRRAAGRRASAVSTARRS